MSWSPVLLVLGDWWQTQSSETERADIVIASMMRLIVKFFPRHTGSKWMVSKLHEVAKAYCSMFCYQFGGPLGKTASRSEEHHGWRSRKNVNTIDQQCGGWMYALFEEFIEQEWLATGRCAAALNSLVKFCLVLVSCIETSDVALTIRGWWWELALNSISILCPDNGPVIPRVTLPSVICMTEET